MSLMQVPTECLLPPPRWQDFHSRLDAFLAFLVLASFLRVDGVLDNDLGTTGLILLLFTRVLCSELQDAYGNPREQDR
jgi:hypothetical protein